MKIMDKEKNKFLFLGLNFHNLSTKEAIENIEHFIQTGTPHMIFTPTAELIVMANCNQQLKEIYNKTDLLTIDSFVVYYTAKLYGKPVKEPVSAVRLMFNFLDVAWRKKYRLYMLGAKEEVVNKTVEVLTKQYPGINITGWRNGYFGFEQEEKIVYDIRDKKPDVLFVAMSSPLKENFINRNLIKMNVPVCLGVGGSFDIIANKYVLAPEWVSKIGMEWFYRFIQEPRRLWKRYLITNTMFLWLLIKNCNKR